MHEFQREIERTVSMEAQNERLVCMALGLAGETGEVVEHIKKMVFQGRELDREKVLNELGDVLWYIGLGLNTLDSSFEDITQRCTEKLRRRYPDGFSEEHNRNRNEGY